MAKKLKVGSIQKTKAGKKVLVATAFELKNLKQVLESDEVQTIMNSTDSKSKKYFNLETKQEQLDGLSEAVNAGRLTSEIAEKIATNVEKMPDYVISDVFVSLDVK